MGYRGDAILQFDWTVGEIMKTLKELEIADNTLIILTSDNGSVIDDGYLDLAEELLGNHRPWGDMRGGKYSNFEAGTRVPFIVNWPDKIKPGVSNALVSHIDLFASMAELVGRHSKEDMVNDSRNQLNVLLGKDTKGRDYIIEAAQSLSVSTGEWKYIAPNNGISYYGLTRTETGNSSEEQLYNLYEDIGEGHNLASEFPQKVKELKELLEQEKKKGCTFD